MGKPGRPFPFRWVLPVCELVVSIAIVWPLWINTASELWIAWRPARNETPGTQGRVINIEVPDSPTPEQQARQDRLDIRLRLPAALNVPVKFIQIPYFVLSRSKMEWTPTGIRWVPTILWFREIWEDVTWPIVGMAFWWMFGRSVEALVAASRRREVMPRIRLLEVILGTAFVVLGTGLFFVMLFDSYSTAGDKVLGVGGGVWAIFGATTVVTAVIQWRLRRRARILIA